MGTKDRKERERAQKQEKIINAAEKLFFKKGFENTTMDEIAEKAEFSKGTLYLYFKNKEALYAAIALRSLDVFTRILEKEVKKGKNSREKLAGIKNAYLKCYMEHKEHMRVLLFAFKYIPLLEKMEPGEMVTAFTQKQALFQHIIISAIEEAKQDADSGISDIDASTQDMFYGGGAILESLFRSLFEVEETLVECYGVRPEEYVLLAYKLLRF